MGGPGRVTAVQSGVVREGAETALASSVSELQIDRFRAAFGAAGAAAFEYVCGSNDVVWFDADAAATVLKAADGEPPRTLETFHARLEPEAVELRAKIADRAREGGAYRIEYQCRTADGVLQWVEERGSWIGAGDTGALRQVGVLRVISEQKKKELHLSYLASYDELTGQLNRSRLREALEARLACARRSNAEAGYVVLGVDDLGGVNASFGFDAADEVIVQIGERVASTLGGDDSLGRTAGNKFGVILADCSEAELRDRCRELVSVVRASVFHTTKGAIAASVSAGGVLLPMEVPSSEVAMARAEAALDEARRAGRASWSLFSEKTDIVHTRRRNSDITDRILSALNDRRIRLAFQPILADVGEKPTHYECLIRMISEDGRVVSAGEFVGAAERLGLVHLLDRRVLELATRALKCSPDIRLNLNVSWETVKDPVWAEGYIAHLRAHPKCADRFTIELTETQAVDALEVSVEFVKALKDCGCRFAVDDFGAGYTSFRNLKALDIDSLKIDGSFVTGVAESRENQLFVRILLDLARNFGVSTVAEWVDNDADARMLKGLGVDYLQGFYLGKPDICPDWFDESSLEFPNRNIPRAQKRSA